LHILITEHTFFAEKKANIFIAKYNVTFSNAALLLTVYSRLFEDVKLQVGPVNAIHAYRWYSRTVSLILMSGEWSTSRSVRFNPKE